jgi:hypothetical protein
MGISIYLWSGAWHWSTEAGFERERAPRDFRCFGILSAKRRVGAPERVLG